MKYKAGDLIIWNGHASGYQQRNRLRTISLVLDVILDDVGRSFYEMVHVRSEIDHGWTPSSTDHRSRLISAWVDQGTESLRP